MGCVRLIKRAFLRAARGVRGACAGRGACALRGACAVRGACALRGARGVHGARSRARNKKRRAPEGRSAALALVRVSWVRTLRGARSRIMRRGVRARMMRRGAHRGLLTRTVAWCYFSATMRPMT